MQKVDPTDRDGEGHFLRKNAYEVEDPNLLNSETRKDGGQWSDDAAEHGQQESFAEKYLSDEGLGEAKAPECCGFFDPLEHQAGLGSHDGEHDDHEDDDEEEASQDV